MSDDLNKTIDRTYYQMVAVNLFFQLIGWASLCGVLYGMFFIR